MFRSKYIVFECTNCHREIGVGLTAKRSTGFNIGKNHITDTVTDAKCKECGEKCFEYIKMSDEKPDEVVDFDTESGSFDEKLKKMIAKVRDIV